VNGVGQVGPAAATCARTVSTSIIVHEISVMTRYSSSGVYSGSAWVKGFWNGVCTPPSTASSAVVRFRHLALTNGRRRGCLCWVEANNHKPAFLAIRTNQYDGRHWSRRHVHFLL
jgi:hypothetical protein